jgi:hypothetical protein
MWQKINQIILSNIAFGLLELELQEKLEQTYILEQTIPAVTARSLSIF